MKTFYLFTLLALSFVMSGCTTPVSHYERAKPALVAETFFSGQLSAHGVVKNFSGKVIRTFNADITAYWRDGTGTLDERFIFDDGEEQKRVWTLRPVEATATNTRRYIGTASDVVGEAEVTVSGNAMFLKYVLQVPYGDGLINLTVDDKMYLVDEGVIINESRLFKFGLPVGKILLTIVKK